VENDFRVVNGGCVVIIAALLVVGAVSHGVIRHIVQTSPLWISIVLGVRRSGSSKWATLPCFVFWLLLMIAIWLFLLGWARIVSGTFSPIEIAMTMIVGLASMLGIVRALGMKSGVRAWSAMAVVFLVSGAAIGRLWAESSAGNRAQVTRKATRGITNGKGWFRYQAGPARHLDVKSAYSEKWLTLLNPTDTNCLNICVSSTRFPSLPLRSVALPRHRSLESAFLLMRAACRA
jgi:hypothetical protein